MLIPLYLNIYSMPLFEYNTTLVAILFLVFEIEFGRFEGVLVLCDPVGF